MNNFADAFEIVANRTTTENGAIVERVSNLDHPLVRCFYQVGSFRNALKNGNGETSGCVTDFEQALKDSSLRSYCYKLALMVRDIERGAGERTLGRILLRKSIEAGADTRDVVCAVTDRYGRWDDVIAIMESLDRDKYNEQRRQLFHMIIEQLNSDIRNEHNVSLLGKWMPSINASSGKTRALARKFAAALKLNCAQYRKMLSDLRAKIDIVERKITNNQWNQIDYNRVPSQAAIRYSTAFNNHDGVRYRQYISAVREGKAKINTKTLGVAQIVAKARANYSHDKTTEDVCNTMWSHLDFPILYHNVVPVCDLSGSMYVNVGGNIAAYDVSVGLSMFLAQSNKGAFHNKIITFSNEPKFIQLSDTNNFVENYTTVVDGGNVGYNTNIERVFDLILSVAIKFGLKDEDLPTIAMFSDMEFDEATKPPFDWLHNERRSDLPSIDTLFETIRAKYKAHGYNMPKLVFWNIANRTATIPITSNDNGMITISGFSQQLIDMVVSDRFDPWSALKDKLDDPRYDVFNKMSVTMHN